MEAAILSEDPLGGAHIGPLLVLLQPLQGQLERPVGIGAAAEAARASAAHSGARALARRADPAAHHAGTVTYGARRSAAPASHMRGRERSGTRAPPLPTCRSTHQTSHEAVTGGMDRAHAARAQGATLLETSAKQFLAQARACFAGRRAAPSATAPTC